VIDGKAQLTTRTVGAADQASRRDSPSLVVCHWRISPYNPLLASKIFAPTYPPLAIAFTSERVAMSRPSHNAIPRVRDTLPRCFTRGRRPHTSWRRFGSRGSILGRSPAVSRVHKAIVNERIHLVFRAVLSNILHAAGRESPGHSEILDILAVDSKKPSRRPVLDTFTSPARTPTAHCREGRRNASSRSSQTPYP
jgi:hypothetical protein